MYAVKQGSPTFFTPRTGYIWKILLADQLWGGMIYPNIYIYIYILGYYIVLYSFESQIRLAYLFG